MLYFWPCVQLVCFIKNLVKSQRMTLTLLMAGLHVSYNTSQHSELVLTATTWTFVTEKDLYYIWKCNKKVAIVDSKHNSKLTWFRKPQPWYNDRPIYFRIILDYIWLFQLIKIKRTCLFQLLLKWSTGGWGLGHFLLWRFHRWQFWLPLLGFNPVQGKANLCVLWNE